MSLLLLSSSRRTVVKPRPGVVGVNGQVLADATGVFHPLGLTLFWALFGWKYERDRILDHLHWISQYGFDYLRILCEVDWTDRTIDPHWPDYTAVLAEFVDTAYDVYGLRSELTIIGGQEYDAAGTPRFIPADLARTVVQTMKPRAHKVMLYEMGNEADNGSGGYDEKVSVSSMIEMAQIVGAHAPNLIALSRPVEYEAMINATKTAGGDAYTLHPRRSDHDAGWSHVRQGYDFKDFPGATWNNEPEGPQSSVEAMDDPLLLVCTRLLGIMCGGAGYVLHVGQGVTGKADANHGRPENMWEVPNIDAIMRAVRACDPLMPTGVENWKCVNNARDDHPLPLDGHLGFWEDSDDRAPAVNKNYAAITSDRFVAMITGAKSVEPVGPVPVGTARRACHVEAYDPLTLQVVASADLSAGQSWTLSGRADSMAAYVIHGRYL